jgi:hypothetical protein
MNIKKIIHELSLKKPTFSSERDFQFHLAQQIYKYYETIELERRFDFEDNTRATIDIIVSIKDTMYPIELKYKKKEQGAQDNGRYLFLKDISRIERFIEQYEPEIGYAIILTDEHLYWDKTAQNTANREFHIYEGRNLEGIMRWQKDSSALKKKELKTPVSLKGKYKVKWTNYSKGFKYLLIEVKKTK